MLAKWRALHDSHDVARDMPLVFKYNTLHLRSSNYSCGTAAAVPLHHASASLIEQPPPSCSDRACFSMQTPQSTGSFRLPPPHMLSKAASQLAQMRTAQWLQLTSTPCVAPAGQRLAFGHVTVLLSTTTSEDDPLTSPADPCRAICPHSLSMAATPEIVLRLTVCQRT